MNLTRSSMAMKSNALTRLCSLDDVDEDEPYRAEIDGAAYAVFKVGDTIYVTDDLCSHGPGLLSEGYVEDCQVECPFHQGRFDLRTGKPTEPPCEIPIRTWKAVVEDGAMTQGLRKKLLPTLKSSRRIGARFAAGMEKAFWSNFITVALPADRASPGSACVKLGVSSLLQAARTRTSNGRRPRTNGRIGNTCTAVN